MRWGTSRRGAQVRFDIAGIDRAEVLRYLGYDGQHMEPELSARIDRVIARCLEVSRPAGVWADFPVEGVREVGPGAGVRGVCAGGEPDRGREPEEAPDAASASRVYRSRSFEAQKTVTDGQKRYTRTVKADSNEASGKDLRKLPGVASVSRVRHSASRVYRSRPFEAQKTVTDGRKRYTRGDEAVTGGTSANETANSATSASPASAPAPAPASVVPVFPELVLRGTTLAPRGRDICAHLAGAVSVGVLAVTLGLACERELRRLSITDPLDGMIFDAAATTLVERAADAAEAQLVAVASERGLYTNSRYSPGYGDWGLEAQPQMLAAVDAQRQLGLTLTPTLLLVPTKSVTAVVGMFATPQPTSKRLCGKCLCREFCTIRKKGRTCRG